METAEDLLFVIDIQLINAVPLQSPQPQIFKFSHLGFQGYWVFTLGLYFLSLLLAIVSEQNELLFLYSIFWDFLKHILKRILGGHLCR